MRFDPAKSRYQTPRLELETSKRKALNPSRLIVISQGESNSETDREVVPHEAGKLCGFPHLWGTCVNITAPCAGRPIAPRPGVSATGPGTRWAWGGRALTTNRPHGCGSGRCECVALLHEHAGEGLLAAAQHGHSAEKC